MPPPPQLKHPKQKKKNNAQNYLKYSSASFQAAVTILAAIWGGHQLDAYFSFEKPVLTALMAIIAVAVSVYILVRQFLKK